MKKRIVSILLFLFTGFIFAQSKNANYIHSVLEDWQSCKTGALTDNSGYVAVSKYNMSVWAGVPRDLSDYLKNVTGRIDDICLTENGRWIVVGDEIQTGGGGVSNSLWNVIRNFVGQGDRITCVTFNDYDEWIVITDKHLQASNQTIQDNLVSTSRKYGFIKSACLSNNAYVIVASDGYFKHGKIPSGLENYLDNNATSDTAYVKFSDGGSWLICTETQAYHYELY